MTQGTVSKAGVIALGGKLGRDARESTKRAFYAACAILFSGKEGKDLTTAAEELSAAGVAKKLGIPQSEVKSLPDSVRRDAFPSGATIARFVGYVRRFPDALPDVSLEVYATAAAAELRTAQSLLPDGKKADKTQADKDGVALVEASLATLPDGETLSIRDARTAWQSGNGATRTAKKADSPDTVGDRVDWLLSQPAAVAEYAKDAENKLGALADMIAEILGETNK